MGGCGGVGTRGASSMCAHMYFPQKVGVDLNIALGVVAREVEQQLGSGEVAGCRCRGEVAEVVIFQRRDGDGGRSTADRSLFASSIHFRLERVEDVS